MLQALTLFGAETGEKAAESAEGIGALGISLTSLIIQLVTFVLVYLVLRKWAFGPILRILQQRRETIENGVRLGEEMKLEKAKLDKAVAKELHDARVKADAIVADAETAARETVRTAEETAQNKAAIIVKEGKERGEQEVARARKALESELVGLISDATEAIIGEKVDAKKDAVLIDRALKESRA
jgi:F-type H+-transporting ATPase subunit b